MALDEWVVIEGDNGAGKTILANKLVSTGWYRINDHPAAKTAQDDANSKAGHDRVAAFLRYNRLCAALAIRLPGPVVQERFWPSTLAAGFADGLLDWQQTEQLGDISRVNIRHPICLVRLSCGLRTRQQRILQRPPVSGSTDDPSESRDDRHLRAMDHLLSKLSMVHTIDTTCLMPVDVYSRTLTLLEGMRNAHH